MKLTIAVLTYNPNGDLKYDEMLFDCLSSINGDEVGDHEVLIIDNGSPTPQISGKGLPNWRYIHLPENRGNIAGQNACFDHAEGEWVLFVSNDVTLQPGCIKMLLKEFTEEDYSVGQVQPKIIRPNGKLDSAGMEYIWPGYGVPGRKRGALVEIVPSICYLIKRSVWAETGGFDERLPGAYEDVDMGIRLAKLGYINYICTKAYAIHKGNATLQYTSKDKWRFHKARIHIIKKHFTGINKMIRLLAVCALDKIRGIK